MLYNNSERKQQKKDQFSWNCPFGGKLREAEKMNGGNQQDPLDSFPFSHQRRSPRFWLIFGGGLFFKVAMKKPFFINISFPCLLRSVNGTSILGWYVVRNGETLRAKRREFSSTPLFKGERVESLRIAESHTTKPLLTDFDSIQPAHDLTGGFDEFHFWTVANWGSNLQFCFLKTSKTAYFDAFDPSMMFSAHFSAFSIWIWWNSSPKIERRKTKQTKTIFIFYF